METLPNSQFSAGQKELANNSSTVHDPRYEAVLIAQAPDYAVKSARKTNQDVHTSQRETTIAHERPIPPEAMQALSNASTHSADAARVQQIMVLYTDGRFETFRPAEQ